MTTPTSIAHVPVIDLAPFGGADPAARALVVEQVRRACEEVGFLVVTGHGIGTDLLDRMGAVSRAFFDLPEPVKAVHRHPERGARYVPMASESVAASLDLVTPPDLKEAYSIYRVDPQDWPAEPAAMRATWQEYYRALDGLAGRIMRIFALALDLDEHWFDDRIDRAHASLWVSNYPAQPTEPLPGQLRAGPHTDYDTLTLLKVEDVPGGLQVETAPGVWSDVPYVPGSYVVNIGDLMARWTNDRWVSTMHRVANPPPGSGPAARRQSIVFFHKPNDDAVIAPIPTCVGPEGPRYAPVLAGEYMAEKGRKQDTSHGRDS
jgi:isopenicillin N synthase-like dioxygenase